MVAILIFYDILYLSLKLFQVRCFLTNQTTSIHPVNWISVLALELFAGVAQHQLGVSPQQGALLRAAPEVQARGSPASVCGFQGQPP